MRFYRGYKHQSGKNESLQDFYRRYKPPITSDHYTCVGLALELWSRLSRLESKFPGLRERLFLVSCEEGLDTLDMYLEVGDHLDLVADDLEKEHVLLALKINVAGRPGVLLCDPGYHIARVITVMKDKIYPHTGWFTQSEDSGVRKEYSYNFYGGSKCVEWLQRETKNGIIQKMESAAIFTSRPYLTAVDVTERLNLVYNFRSLLSRDTKGQIIAGLYFKIKPGEKEFTLLYRKNGTKQKLKVPFDLFLKPNEIGAEYKYVVNQCNEQLNLPAGSLLSMLNELAKIMSDVKFVNQLLAIYAHIATLMMAD